MFHKFDPFILGGVEVLDFSLFSYQLSLRYVDVHVCGASIIAEQWALTGNNLNLNILIILIILIPMPDFIKLPTKYFTND